MTDRQGSPIVVLMADDDEDDLLLTREALEESRLANEFRSVEDGVELLEYLNHTGRYADPALAPTPGLILLDLNMPRMDGREALRLIKSDQRLRQIPVVVLTTSDADTDVVVSYDLGANSYITKPVTFEKLIEVVRMLCTYWFEIVALPPAA